ncbi:hypothetical protein V9T40_001887 [Parthenolecanium corni]|uniref:Uncharacterized protein n=1 Tax=Parthenolecanium corni TaxID=536013 RepID=A0AAN9THD9_9HEMI
MVRKPASQVDQIFRASQSAQPNLSCKPNSLTKFGRLIQLRVAQPNSVEPSNQLDQIWPRSAAYPSIGEVLKAKLSPQILTHQLQRRLLPRTEIQQKQINQTQNIKSKSPKTEVNDELEIEYNHLPEIGNSLDVEEDHGYRGMVSHELGTKTRSEEEYTRCR